MITYYKTYGITVFKKHVDAKHSIIVKKFEEKINNEIIRNVETQYVKKRPNVPTSAIFVLFCCKRTFQKGWCVAKRLFARFWPFDYEK